MKSPFLILLLLIGWITQAQSVSKNYRIKVLHPQKDTIQLDSTSIYPYHFSIVNREQQEIPQDHYTVDFVKSTLLLHHFNDTITVKYYVYPSFLTQTSTVLDKKLIAPYATQNPALYTLPITDGPFQKPFEGLQTSGSLVRGLTVGNNQNSVLNSSLDLQIEGKLSESISLKASISDTSVPIQQGGYTQDLHQFDNVFIELSNPNWTVKGGDINLKNSESEFLSFTKKVSGVQLTTNHTINENYNLKTEISGALVQGKFVSNSFKGKNGNQGPYQLKGNQGELFIVVVPGSETVFINGIPLKSGPENDYTIDYQTAEITFNATYPVNADLRITVEFQYNQRNYNRFVTYDKASVKKEKWELSTHYYGESDLKNQPVQNDLTDEQLLILTDAGNDRSKMFAPSAMESNYDEAKVLYKKTAIGTIEIYEYSTNPADILYQVSFSFVGINQGSYNLKNTIAFGKVFEYVGANLGSYNPIIQLSAPDLLEVIGLNGQFKPTDKTAITTEVAWSNRDLNLFSPVDDEQNKGIATKLQWKQLLIDRSWKLESNISYRFVDKKFSTVEKINSIEYTRDWNIETVTANQQRFIGSLTLSNTNYGNSVYSIEKLIYGAQFYEGSKNSVINNYQWKKFHLNTDYSFLNYSSLVEKGSFIRFYSNIKYQQSNYWIGASNESEKNHRKDKNTKVFTPQSFEFNNTKIYTGFGNLEKTNVEIGYAKSENDSIRNNTITNVGTADTYYLKSQLLNSERSKLSVYAHYRNNQVVNSNNEASLNTKINYFQELLKGFFQWQTIYETLAGTVPQQEYTYIKTEIGNGFFTWNDYNQNGIQELNEFEVTKFKDEASYLRVALPTVNYTNTHQAKISQSLTINPAQWHAKTGLQNFLSHFYNQSFLLIENKQLKRDNLFNLNPFNTNSQDLIGLTYNLKNSIFLNRAKNRYTTAYHFTEGKQKSLYLFEELSNNFTNHQLQFSHQLNDFWLLELSGKTGHEERVSSAFLERNYQLNEEEFFPKLTLKVNDKSNADFFYSYTEKNNEIGTNEMLIKQVLGVSFQFMDDKGRNLKSEFQYINNNFEGLENSSVAYQMLEGLKKGKNFTWLLIANQKLTDYLYLNLNYTGRKSEESSAIHTGSVQLRLNF